MKRIFPLAIVLCLCCVYRVTHADAPEKILLCNAPGLQHYPQARSDGQVGTVVFWVDFRQGKGPDIYAQRIDASGKLLWRPNGVAVCRQTGGVSQIRRRGDRFIVVWSREDSRLYAQAVTAPGNACGVKTAC